MDKNEVASVAYRYVDLSDAWVWQGGRMSAQYEAKQVRSVTGRSFTMKGIPGCPRSEEVEGERILRSRWCGSEREQGSEITCWILFCQVPKVEAGRRYRSHCPL